MIEVTRLNGKTFHVNGLYIETVEAHPDTMLTLTNGKKFVVTESVEEVRHRIVDFYRQANVLQASPPEGGSADE
ncbi:flagellar FlbD family protein [Bacillus fonticola]|uniref:flagellar FlbD family protein n=1 Tax=Bacillus fonticola TaxID=2728853 RepID=UPI0014744A8A|nr:flagellar FlbD family protein [Bacillus fonticola]